LNRRAGVRRSESPLGIVSHRIGTNTGNPHIPAGGSSDSGGRFDRERSMVSPPLPTPPPKSPPRGVLVPPVMAAGTAKSERLCCGWVDEWMSGSVDGWWGQAGAWTFGTCHIHIHEVSTLIHPSTPSSHSNRPTPAPHQSIHRPGDRHTFDSMMTTYGLVPTIAETRLSDKRCALWGGGKWGKNKTGWKDRSNRIEGLDCCIPTHPRHPLRAVRSVPLWLSRRGRLTKLLSRPRRKLLSPSRGALCGFRLSSVGPLTGRGSVAAVSSPPTRNPTSSDPALSENPPHGWCNWIYRSHRNRNGVNRYRKIQSAAASKPTGIHAGTSPLSPSLPRTRSTAQPAPRLDVPTQCA